MRPTLPMMDHFGGSPLAPFATWLFTSYAATSLLMFDIYIYISFNPWIPCMVYLSAFTITFNQM